MSNSDIDEAMIQEIIEEDEDNEEQGIFIDCDDE